MSSARVMALYVSPARGEDMVVRPQVEAVVNHGLADDAHARPGGSRQLLLMDSETLKDLALRPGFLKENITTSGLNVMALATGTRLQLGEAVLEITQPCEPCSRWNQFRAGLSLELRGRRGMLARVLTGGVIRVGDAIAVSAAPGTSPA